MPRESVGVVVGQLDWYGSSSKSGVSSSSRALLLLLPIGWNEQAICVCLEKIERSLYSGKIKVRVAASSSFVVKERECWPRRGEKKGERDTMRIKRRN